MFEDYEAVPTIEVNEVWIQSKIEEEETSVREIYKNDPDRKYRVMLGVQEARERAGIKIDADGKIDKIVMDYAPRTSIESRVQEGMAGGSENSEGKEVVDAIKEGGDPAKVWLELGDMFNIAHYMFIASKDPGKIKFDADHSTEDTRDYGDQEDTIKSTLDSLLDGISLTNAIQKETDNDGNPLKVPTEIVRLLQHPHKEELLAVMKQVSRAKVEAAMDKDKNPKNVYKDERKNLEKLAKDGSLSDEQSVRLQEINNLTHTFTLNKVREKLSSLIYDESNLDSMISEPNISIEMNAIVKEIFFAEDSDSSVIINSPRDNR